MRILIVRHALTLNVFSESLMSEECVVIAILKMLNEGSKTELALNLFLFTNFSRWKTEYLRDFIDEIKQIIERKH